MRLWGTKRLVLRSIVLDSIYLNWPVEYLLKEFGVKYNLKNEFF